MKNTVAIILSLTLGLFALGCGIGSSAPNNAAQAPKAAGAAATAVAVPNREFDWPEMDTPVDRETPMAPPRAVAGQARTRRSNLDRFNPSFSDGDDDDDDDDDDD